ncbi:unnamed protein product, partial [Iphiclides podalirius]
MSVSRRLFTFGAGSALGARRAASLCDRRASKALSEVLIVAADSSGALRRRQQRSNLQIKCFIKLGARRRAPPLNMFTIRARALKFHGHTLKLKAPTWSQSQLQEAIQAVVTQRMRFTQAATYYGIPKGTLYDNILGKSKRMAVLDEVGLLTAEERAVLDYCCETSVSPYNRRTKKSLAAVLAFVEKLRRGRDASFTFTGLTGYRWWWAFCKKHSIVSLYYEGSAKLKLSKIKAERRDVSEES